MGLDFFRRAVTLAEQLARPGQVLQHTIQTNGTLLDDEWARSSRAPVPRGPQHRRAARDARRVPRVEERTRQLRRRDAGVGDPAQPQRRSERPVHPPRRQRATTRSRCTGSSGTSSKPATSSSSRSSNARRSRRSSWRTQDGASDPAAGGCSTRRQGAGHRAVDRPEQYGDFLVAVFDEWIRRDVGTVFVQMFDVTLGSHLGHAQPVHPLADMRQRARARAQRRPVLMRSLRRARPPARQHPHRDDGRAGAIAEAAGVRPAQARQPPPLLPRVRRALRLPRRVPEGPVPHDA